MALTNKGLVEFCRGKLGVPYVYGMKGSKLTKEMFDDLQKRYGKKMVWDSDSSKIGQVCCDCSGLISWFTNKARSSAGFHDAAAKRFGISTISEAPVGALVWKDGHIGVYIGIKGGVPYYIAEDGSKSGCREAKLPANFTHWFLCPDISYGETAGGAENKPVDSGGTDGAFKVRDIVSIREGSVYGGLYEKTRGLPVPASVVGRSLTISQIARGEALLKEINSWVDLKYLDKKERI
jgi:hypothetical protein